MALLSIHEFQKVAITSSFCCEGGSPSITTREASVIVKLNSHYRRMGVPEPFEVNSSYVKAKQYVGVVNLGTNCLEVLPKIDSKDKNDVEARVNLARMLQVTNKLDLGVGPYGSVSAYEDGILEVFFDIFLRKYEQASRAGLIRQYVNTVEQIPSLRGRWQISDRVKKGPHHAHLFNCSFDELSEDNAYNQLLKQALLVVVRNSRRLATVTRANQHLLAHVDVSDVRTFTDNPHRGRQTRAFDPCLDLAELFVNCISPNVVSGKAAMFSIFFDMNKLFEEFVALNLSKVLPGRVHIQRPERHLAVEDGTGVSRFRLKPDIVVTDIEGKFSEIIDTKWKRLTSDEPNFGVTQADLYQVLTYARQYECRTVSLVFPASGNMRGLVSTLRVNRGDEVIRIFALDLTDVSNIRDQMRQYWQ